MIILFWILIGFTLFSLFGYGILWIVLSIFIRPRAQPSSENLPASATMIIAARNEQASIAKKLRSVISQDVRPIELSVLVVSDGSTDETLKQAKTIMDPMIDVIETAEHKGKANALNEGLKQIHSDVVIFSDANSILQPESLRNLLSHFGDPDVGGVCGRPEPFVTKSGWMAYLERLFWRYDIALKTAESKVAGVVSAQGTLYAMRRSLLPQDIPADMADDFYVSTLAPLNRLRLVQENKAVALEQVTDDVHDELMRRVRSTERGWRALLNVAVMLNPFSYGLYSVQLICHKFFRRLIAFTLPVIFILNLYLITQGWIYVALFAAQLGLYSVGFGRLFFSSLRKIPGSSLAAYFCMGHLAMGWGVLRYYQGHKSTRWKPARMEHGE